MKVALCQINTTIGAFNENVDRILTFLKKAAQEKAELAVFPELCLSSYPALDLLDRPDFWQANEKALERLLKEIQKIGGAPETIILGSIMRSENPKIGRPIQNTALVLQKGKIAYIQRKQLLPTYDVFDETRYFEPGTEALLWQSPFGKLGVSICEDAWFEDKPIYSADPALKLRGAQLSVNISASPFEMNKRSRRLKMIAGFVQRVQAPTLYVNQVGANDEILFDGNSLVYSAQGEVLFELPTFRETIGVVDLNLNNGERVDSSQVWELHAEARDEKKWEKISEASQKSESSEIELVHKGLVLGIKDYFRKTGFQKAVIGLSGGIDSAVVAVLAAEALGPANVIAVSLPTQYSSSHSLTDAEELARKVGLDYRIHSLKFILSAVLMELKPSFKGASPDVTEENLQARLRAILLMAIANKSKALLLTTGNKSELAVGYCTTYGDMAGALDPIGDLYKTKVYELARYMNEGTGCVPENSIPENIMKKAPSAELKHNQTDQDSLPPYEVLDQVLELYFEGLASEGEIVAKGFEPEMVKSVVSMIRTSEFKRRQAAPALKVTSKAFGLGRRVPVAKAF